MRYLSLIIASCYLLLLSAPTHAAPGYQWEMRMEMDGMPFPMPGINVCAAKTSNEPPVTKDDGECKILNKKKTGNRFQWTAQCKDGTMVGDITSTPTSYNGTMKMTDKSGRTTNMKMSGKRLGDCDYQDRSGEIKALQQQSEDSIAQLCQNSLDNMQGQMLTTGSCPKEKIIFCQRLATPDGYSKATQNFPAEMINTPASGFPQVMKSCGLDNVKLLPKLCARGVADASFDFVSRFCPTENPKLCAKALGMNQMNYLGANCPNEKAAAIKQHCEGRRYTSQIDAKYRDFCAEASHGGDFSNDGSANRVPPAETNPPNKPVDPAAPDNLQEGIKQLRNLFGF